MTTLASPLPARPTSAKELPAITTAQWQSVLAAEQLGHAMAMNSPTSAFGSVRLRLEA